ncbi:hypothetical protein G9A89_006954 [Geosiphon pyriformis]|nr:hypothetical protein G9A89_006954 [Geosiphon pyriformis]
MYTNAKVDGYSIKLILDSELAGSIITRQLIDQLGCQVDHAASTRIITADGVTKPPIGEIDDFPIEVNNIIVPIKVLIMKATQYQALIGNDWLFKTNTTLDWNTQKLQLNQNSQHTWVPATCGHFKPITMSSTPLIKFEKEKEKQRKKPTWEATIDAWTNNNQSKMPPILDWEEKNKEKGKGREENILEETTTAEEITSGWKRKYSRESIKKPPYISLKYKDCGKKLSAIGNDMATQKYKASGTTNHVLLAANNYLTKKYGTTFLVEEECTTLHANT